MKYFKRLRLAIVLAMGIGLLLAACGPSEPEMFKVGFITGTTLYAQTFEGFVDAMTELGYVEGENITYVGYWEFVNDPLKYLEENEVPEIAQKLVEADVDLIVSATTPPTKAAHEASEGTGIPILFSSVTDPVASSFIESYARPGLRATGLRYGMPENAQDGMRLEWMARALPDRKRYYTMYNPDSVTAAPAVATIKRLAPDLGIELVEVHVHSDEEADAAWENLPDDIDAIFVLPSLESYTSLSRHLEVMTRLPVGTNSRYRVETEGAFLAFGSDPYIDGKALARMADQILQGTDPAELPVEVPDFFLYVNLKAANILGIQVPDEVLVEAYEVIR